MTIYRRFHLEPRNEPIVPLAEKILVDGLTLDGDTYGLNVDPPYQREPVWGEERRRNLIRSILMGLSIGIVTMNERPFPEWKVVIDGKQRLLAIRAFITGEFAVPAEWWEPEHLADASSANVYYGDLSKHGKRAFDAQAVIQTNTGHHLALTDEEELFDLVNYGGVPQGASDIAS